MGQCLSGWWLATKAMGGQWPGFGGQVLAGWLLRRWVTAKPQPPASNRWTTSHQALTLARPNPA